MSMNYFQAVSTHTARKAHRCDYCGSRIPVGTVYAKMVGKWEGEFYEGKGHADCRDLWSALYDEWAYDEGMPWDISEVFVESGEIHAAQEALDTQRGRFPHAVNRIEFRLLNWLTWDDEEDAA